MRNRSVYYVLINDIKYFTWPGTHSQIVSLATCNNYPVIYDGNIHSLNIQQLKYGYNTNVM
jgi:hypothetical protein